MQNRTMLGETCQETQRAGVLLVLKHSGPPAFFSSNVRPRNSSTPKLLKRSVGRPRTLILLNDDDRPPARPAVWVERIATGPYGRRLTVRDRRTRHGTCQRNSEPVSSSHPGLALRRPEFRLASQRLLRIGSPVHLLLVEPHLRRRRNLARRDSSAESHRRSVFRRRLRPGGHRRQRDKQRHWDWQPFHGQNLPSVPLLYLYAHPPLRATTGTNGLTTGFGWNPTWGLERIFRIGQAFRGAVEAANPGNLENLSPSGQSA